MDTKDKIIRALNGALMRLERPTDNHLDTVANIAQAKDLVRQARDLAKILAPPGRPAFLDQALNEGDGVYRP